MRSYLLAVGIILAFSLVACGKEAAPEATPAPAPAAPPAPPPGATPDPPTEPTAEEIPVAEDFEQETEESITADNYMAELDAIEKELDAK